MTTITVTSTDLPGISFAGGLPTFTVGHTYEITDEQALSIKKQYDTFPATYKARLQLTFADSELPAGALASAVPSPPLPPSVADEPPSTLQVDDVTELSDEDSELVDLEVSKLLGKKISEAEPILIATGGNPDLPRLLRQTYIERVIDHTEIQKSLKDTALKLLEQI